MTDYLTAGSLGERIQAARKARGMSARQLAEAINGVPTQATIENIELGRKASVDIVQLLNIAMAVRLPISYLLAPVGKPNALVDLPGLSAELSSMNVSEFDAWIASVPGGGRVPSTLDERNAIAELQALREWKAKSAELSRLRVVADIEQFDEPPSPAGYPRIIEDRIIETERELGKLAEFLRSSGWAFN